MYRATFASLLMAALLLGLAPATPSAAVPARLGVAPTHALSLLPVVGTTPQPQSSPLLSRYAVVLSEGVILDANVLSKTEDTGTESCYIVPCTDICSSNRAACVASGESLSVCRSAAFECIGCCKELCLPSWPSNVYPYTI